MGTETRNATRTGGIRQWHILVAALAFVWFVVADFRVTWLNSLTCAAFPDNGLVSPRTVCLGELPLWRNPTVVDGVGALGFWLTTYFVVTFLESHRSRRVKAVVMSITTLFVAGLTLWLAINFTHAIEPTVANDLLGRHSLQAGLTTAVMGFNYAVAAAAVIAFLGWPLWHTTPSQQQRRPVRQRVR